MGGRKLAARTVVWGLHHGPNRAACQLDRRFASADFCILVQISFCTGEHSNFIVWGKAVAGLAVLLLQKERVGPAEFLFFCV
eukprot:s368_g16.t1